MKNLFIVGAKLLGILYFFWAITSLPFIGSMLQVLFYGIPRDVGMAGIQGTLISTLCSFVLNIAIGFALLFKTEKVSRLLKIPEEAVDNDSIFPEFLRMGLILIGFYVLADGIPEILKSLFEMRGTGFIGHSFGTLLGGGTKVLLGGWFILSNEKIANFVRRRKKETS